MTSSVASRPFADKIPEWAVSLPVPKSNPVEIAAADVVNLLRTKRPGEDFLIVDVRRTDWEVSSWRQDLNGIHILFRVDVDVVSIKNTFVRTAINLPAQSFYQTIPSLLPMLRRIPLVIFYCNSCTLTGRGPRTAAWYQDALDAESIKDSEARILAGGIKGWAEQYAEDEALTTTI